MCTPPVSFMPRVFLRIICMPPVYLAGSNDKGLIKAFEHALSMGESHVVQELMKYHVRVYTPRAAPAS